ncbi:uncharacterized protein LOC110039443 isoform X2 [Phalaenopsis equestris]|uniref:uncharacterized protein LOC110039443 isoform X2 n=1 Tax=Phalaenopsis equestris TaxID=78828 RepID=UPI0009E43AA7|nr:uncharacterized protein LOC110039443 isoform X2 [Phalaenopsis equestris]
MPIGSNFPKVGKKVTVVVGDPIQLEDLIVDDTEEVSRVVLYDAVSSRISHRLRELKILADKLASEHTIDLQYYFTHKAKGGYALWQRVDWEEFGMVYVMQSDEKAQISKEFFSRRPKNDQEQRQEPNSAKTVEMSFSHGYGGGIVSRVRGYMNPTELMWFAASGLFWYGKLLDETAHDNIQDPFLANGGNRMNESTHLRSEIRCEFFFQFFLEQLKAKVFSYSFS